MSLAGVRGSLGASWQPSNQPSGWSAGLLAVAETDFQPELKDEDLITPLSIHLSIHTLKSHTEHTEDIGQSAAGSHTSVTSSCFYRKQAVMVTNTLSRSLLMFLTCQVVHSHSDNAVSPSTSQSPLSLCCQNNNTPPLPPQI